MAPAEPNCSGVHAILEHLPAIERNELAEILVDAWRCPVPRTRYATSRNERRENHDPLQYHPGNRLAPMPCSTVLQNGRPAPPSTR